MEGSNRATPDVHESVRRGVHQFLRSFLFYNIINYNIKLSFVRGYRKLIESRLWTLTEMIVSPNTRLFLDFFKMEGSNRATPEFHDSVRKGVHCLLTSFFSDIDFDANMEYFCPGLYLKLVEGRLWTLTDVIVSPDPRLFRDSFYKSDMEFLYAVDGLRCKDYSVRGKEKLLTEQPTQEEPVDDQQRTYAWKWYTDNARYPVCKSTPVQILPKSLLEDPMEAHCHAVRRMYRCLQNPVEISSALSRFYKKKSSTKPKHGESIQADDTKVCGVKKQWVTLGQQIYFKTLGGDAELMLKIAENLGLQVCCCKEFDFLKDLERLPVWDIVIAATPIATCTEKDCVFCYKDSFMRLPVYIDIECEFLDVNAVALDRETKKQK